MSEYSYQKTKDPRIKKRNGWYHARFTRKGVRVQEALNTKSFTVAQRLVEEIENCIMLGVNWKKEKELFETAWPDFLEDKAKGVKTSKGRPATLKEYIGMGERYYLDFFSSFPIQDIDESKWVEFVNWLQEKRPDLKLENPRKYFQGFLSWAMRKGKIKEKPELWIPSDDVDEDEQGESVGKAYTKEELRAIHDWLDEHADLSFKLYVYMGMYMGMRSGEITQLKLSRLDRQKWIIQLKPSDTKIGKGRKVPIHPKVLPLFQEQLKHGKRILFPNRWDDKRAMDPTGFKRPWNQLREDKNIEGRFHDFKHTFITNALANKMNPVVVSEITGTSMRVIQDVYLHLTDDDLSAELERFEI